ncbi:MAG: VTT domain-containing protein [Patescibacteria group bacterium]
MIEYIITIIRDFILPYGAFGVFFASIVEEVIAPIPSALVLTASGFFLIPDGSFFDSLGRIFIIIAIPGALGVTVGSLLFYGIAYTSGKPALIRWGRYFGVAWEDVEKLEKRFERGHVDEVALFTARTIPIIPSVVISSFCGFVRLPLKEYLVYSFLGTIVRAFFLGIIGWQVGDIYMRMAEYMNIIESFVFIFIIFAIIFFIARRLYMRRKIGGQENVNK